MVPLQRVTAPFELMRENLELDDNELRKVLANIQRYMHDLNITVAFCDEARAYIRDHVRDHSARVYPALPTLDLHATYAFLEAEIRTGANNGNEVPFSSKHHFTCKGRSCLLAFVADAELAILPLKM